MKQAGNAMAQIHGKLTIDKVDETMYVLHYRQREKVKRAAFLIGYS